MERASHPADSTDRSNAPAMPEVHSDAYDWQGLANNPGLGKRFKFWLEALWQGIERKLAGGLLRSECPVPLGGRLHGFWCRPLLCFA